MSKLPLDLVPIVSKYLEPYSDYTIVTEDDPNNENQWIYLSYIYGKSSGKLIFDPQTASDDDLIKDLEKGKYTKPLYNIYLRDQEYKSFEHRDFMYNFDSTSNTFYLEVEQLHIVFPAFLTTVIINLIAICKRAKDNYDYPTDIRILTRQQIIDYKVNYYHTVLKQLQTSLIDDKLPK